MCDLILSNTNIYMFEKKNTVVIHLTNVIQQMCFMTRKITMQTGHNPFLEKYFEMLFIFSLKYQIIENEEDR